MVLRTSINSLVSIGFLSLSLLTAAACGDDAESEQPDAAGGNADAGADAAGQNDDGGGNDGGGTGITITEVTGGNFVAPESALWDSANQVWYVSNFGQPPFDKNAMPGWITRLSATGEVMEERWVDDLIDPAGMALLDDRLYVADGTTVKSINTQDPTDIETVTIPNVMFLNDVAAGPTAVYVSATLDNQIYQVTPRPQGPPQAAVFVEGPELENPNGLLVEEDGLIVASIGTIGENEALAPIQKVSFADPSMITPVGTVEGKFDGIEANGDGYVVTDFRGQIYSVNAEGTASVVIDLVADGTLMSTADLGFDSVSKTVVIPDLLGNKVVFFTLP